MSEKVFINQQFYCDDFNKMLRDIRVLEAELSDFLIELVFQGGGFDDEYWCDYKGIFVRGYRLKTKAELEAEAVKAERKRLAEIARQKSLLPRIAARLTEEEQALVNELANAKERLHALTKEARHD